MNATGMGASPAAQQAPSPRAEITHIEIRRVQNGFVIAGINLNVFESHRFAGEHPQQATFIAKDVPELANLLQWIVDGADMKWLPTVDLPVWDMERRMEFAKQNQANLQPSPAPAPAIFPHVSPLNPSNPPPFGHAGLTPNGP